MRDTTLRKVVKVIKSMDSPLQLPAVERYIELYFKLYGKQNEWFKDNRHDQSISSILRKIHGTFIIPTDESFKIPFNKGESLQYPFWAMRRKC